MTHSPYRLTLTSQYDMHTICLSSLDILLSSLLWGHRVCSITMAYKHISLSYRGTYALYTITTLLKNTPRCIISIYTPAHRHVLCRCTLNLCGWPVNQSYQHLVSTPGPKKHFAPWPAAAGWLQDISQQTLDTSRSSLHIRWNN